MTPEKPKQGESISVVSDTSIKIAGKIITQNAVGLSRPWAKLWVSPWLDGTTRYECTGAQRSLWLDVIALAARSRFPGVICAGIVGGKLMGYPISFYQILDVHGELDVIATLELFQSTGKISITITSENPKMIVVSVIKWSEYQPPFDGAARVKKHRQKKRIG
jgi:hypothetical protein